MSKARSAPPDLPGFTFVEAIGGGGFADVHLYIQHRPNRQVAIKVLRAEHLSDESMRQFGIEADVMAEISSHPYIVSVFDTNVAPDGRPYIVMEYYPQPHFGLRARGGHLGVPDVLRVGVQVASAVESAHRAGILHRDIKPANILTSAYGRPGLTDFGIAGVGGTDALEAAAGVSIAFASPESLTDEGARGSVASDVFSLAATLYALLTGSSPRWVPGGDNSDAALLQRGIAGSAPSIERDDVPSSLKNLIAHGMATEPANRPPTALALAHALQDVEQELRLPVTPVEVREDAPTPVARRDRSDEDGTRRATPKVVRPDAPAEPAARPDAIVPITAAPGPAAQAPGGAANLDDPRRDVRPSPLLDAPPSSSTAAAQDTDTSSPAVEEIADTRLRAPAVAAPAPPDVPRTPKTRRDVSGWLVGGAVAVLLIIVVVVLVAMRGDDESPPTPTTVAFVDDPGDALALSSPPTDVTAAIGPDGVLTVDFTEPEVDTAAQYRLILIDAEGRDRTWPGSDEVALDADGPPVTAPGFTPGEVVCVEVSTLVDGPLSDPVRGCTR